MGLFCVLPSTLAVAINFAVMGWFGIPLGVCHLHVRRHDPRIGVDFAIHLLEGYDQARANGLSSPRL